MARPLRIEYEGAWYHVSNSAISKQSLFTKESHRLLFLELLDDVHQLFNVQICAYALLDDSYHLLISTPDANLSKAMQYLNGNYTQKFNQDSDRSGPLFRGRFRAILISADMYLLQVHRYIHWLPVLLNIAPEPQSYPWSSCKDYFNHRQGPRWLKREEVISRLQSGCSAYVYQSYLEAGIDLEIARFYSRLRGSPVLGPRSFKNELAAKFRENSVQDVPDIQQLKHKPAITEIIEQVDDKLSSQNLTQLTCNKTLTRNIAIALCRELGGYSLKEIAEKFNINHHRSISVIINRVKKQISANTKLHNQYDAIRREVAVVLR